MSLLCDSLIRGELLTHSFLLPPFSMALGHLLAIVIFFLAVANVSASPTIRVRPEWPEIRGVFSRDVLPLGDSVSQFRTNVSTIRVNFGESIQKTLSIITLITRHFRSRYRGEHEHF
jgi:hypothetical protein